MSRWSARCSVSSAPSNKLGRIADSQSQEIIETLMQDNSAADTSDDNMCDEITNATIGAVRSSVQMIVQQAGTYRVGPG